MEFSLGDPDGYYVTISALDPPRLSPPISNCSIATAMSAWQ
jgi:hypothetical protein